MTDAVAASIHDDCDCHDLGVTADSPAALLTWGAMEFERRVTRNHRMNWKSVRQRRPPYTAYMARRDLIWDNPSKRKNPDPTMGNARLSSSEKKELIAYRSYRRFMERSDLDARYSFGEPVSTIEVEKVFRGLRSAT
jgi:hypothetical protein